jgi:hypothetical protein
MKTFLDALRMPQNLSEISADTVPQGDQDPFFCLLEDDNLITRLSVDTDRYLKEGADASDVCIVLRVTTRPTSVTFGNVQLI